MTKKKESRRLAFKEATSGQLVSKEKVMLVQVELQRTVCIDTSVVVP